MTATAEVLIELVEPLHAYVDPVRLVVGETLKVAVRATARANTCIRAVLKIQTGNSEVTSVRMDQSDNEVLAGTYRFENPGDRVVWVEAWIDERLTWLHLSEARRANQRLSLLSVSEGIQIVKRHTDHQISPTASLDELIHAVASLPEDGVSQTYLRPGETPSRTCRMRVEVNPWRAGTSSWYTFFPRSEKAMDYGSKDAFKASQRRLQHASSLGFDTILLPPIHPIGVTSRKGPNYSENAGRDDPGSPWAVGNDTGGHDEVDHELGTRKSYREFVDEARRLGLEVVFDLALQVSPDHPYVTSHPEWIQRTPSGDPKHPEFPPKEYRDIYALDFASTHGEELLEELIRVVHSWIEAGVRIFRVDNPHTKPFWLWERLANRVRVRHPDVFFVGEVLAPLPILISLSKIAFQQTYTHLPWKQGAREIVDYCNELLSRKHFLRPLFMANTPDTLVLALQENGVNAFRCRALLAGLLSPSWGIYSGFELAENEPRLHGSQEYLDSEKFQIRIRNYDQVGSDVRDLMELIKQVNRLRAQIPAILEWRSTRFLSTTSDDLIAIYRSDHTDWVIIVISLDSGKVVEGEFEMPTDDPAETVPVFDHISNSWFNWGARNYVRLDPSGVAAHVCTRRGPQPQFELK